MGCKSPLAWRPSQGGGTAERSKQHQAGRCSPHWPGSRGLRACPSDSSETPREGEFPKRRTCSLPLPPGSAPFLWLAPLPLFLPPLAFRSSPPLHQGWVPVYPRQASISQGLLRRLRTHGHLFIQQSRTRGAGRCMAALEGLAENGPRAPFSKGRNRGGAEKGKRDLTHSRRSLRGS